MSTKALLPPKITNKGVLFGATIYGLFILLFWGYSQFSVKQQLTQILQQQLPAKLQSALYYTNDNGPVIQLIQQNIDSDLNILTVSSLLPRVQQCSATVIHLMSKDANQSGLKLITIKWKLGHNQLFTHLAFDCDTPWIPTLFYPLGFASVLLLLGYLLPQPLTTKGQQIRQHLLQHLSVYRAHQLAQHLSVCSDIQLELLKHLLNHTQHKPDISNLVAWLEQPRVSSLDETQLTWFMLASDKYKLSKEQALDVALAPPTLIFTEVQNQLIIHGLPVTLLKTPYFYYLWYACLRYQTDGWYLNPPINRSDKTGAKMLIDLMQSSGGHSKAINDLLDCGLRAKTLDQNRNKLKAELISLLGETLAQDYLFDTDRDLKSGRYRYRLSLEAQKITLPPTLTEQLK
ncbi:hypothetical protein [uncultured Paraglaciecola sp.]|uniref:hypothetical protein n=1 Tax=uncultured Paraglaciecola sp. TaxID=1765024 RepID=UPI0030D7019D|tara:strand:+ start:368348 stop:369553 length:1206 start_codon:yes stop_codon:yes gene_type:complete